MTTLALDSNAILDVAEPVVRRQTHESTGTRPEALPALLARQRAAFLRDGPPSLARRQANLKKLRAAVLARRAIWKRRSMPILATASARDRHHGTAPAHVGDRLPEQEPAALHASRAPSTSRFPCASAAPTSSISRSALSASWLRGTIRSRSP